ncbi:MAG: hypothetical protein JSR66_15500 [Proteobacteria bacterium]|nr:hypothetical protein [Pseudomonadota bacterium]
MIDNNNRWIARSGTSAAALGAGLICLVGPRVAGAVTDFNPFGTVAVQHSSNIFQLPDKQALSPGSSYTDTVTQFIGGATADFDWGPEQLALNGRYSRLQYAENDSLNHYESEFGGKFDWLTGPIFSSTVDYTQSRTISAPGNTLSQQLEMQTDHAAHGTFRFTVSPRWRLEIQPTWHQLDSPLPAFPDFGYRETSAAGSLSYNSLTKLWSGVRFSYLDGAFHHIKDATQYNQKIVEATSTYAVTNITSFDFRAGYTWRNTSLVNPADASDLAAAGGTLGSTNGFTGSIGLTRKMTVKTGINFRVFREVSSFGAGANSDISTGVESGVKWDPDFRFTISANYRYTRESIEGVQVITGFAGRSDKVNAYELSVGYHAARWLTVRPYASRYTRSSNLERASYNSTIVGIDFTARLHPPKL